MAFDFSTVTSITIPEGLVTKLAIDGVTVWQQESTPEPVVDPTDGTMSFGNDTQLDAETGTVEFKTTPTIDENGVVDFSDLII